MAPRETNVQDLDRRLGITTTATARAGKNTMKRIPRIIALTILAALAIGARVGTVAG